MDMHAPIVLDLPLEVHAALRRMAQAAGVAPSDMARHLLTVLLSMPSPGDAARIPAGVEAGAAGRPALLAPIRALLAADLSGAVGWSDLQTRLARHGYTFRERGGGLALYCTRTAAAICKASELGWAYADLMRRFGQPFPGHSHDWIAQRSLRPAMSRKYDHPDLFADPGGAENEDDADDDIILVEPY